MDILKEKFLNYKSFDECSIDLEKKSHEPLALQILCDLKLDLFVRTRIFLSAFLLYFFPDYLIGSDEKSQNLKNHVDKIFNEPESNLQKNVMDFSVVFEDWRGDDFVQLKSDLIDNYHFLSVEMLNAKNESRENFLKTKQLILECAKKIGFEKELLNYIPVVFNTSNFLEQSEKAFCDLIEQDIRERKFDRLRNTLSVFVQFFSLFSKKEKQQEILNCIDIPFIEQQFFNGVFEKQDYIRLLLYMYDLMLEIQSRARDEFLLEKKKELENEDGVSVPKHLIYLYELIENFIDDVNQLQKI
jgi:hypothetical protein